MSEQVLDPAIFNEMRELMDDALPEFIDTYLDNSPKLIVQMEQGLANGNSEAVVQGAHQLKGGSGSIGASRLFELAQQIEQLARDNDIAGVEPVLAMLKTEFGRVEEALKEHM